MPPAIPRRRQHDADPATLAVSWLDSDQRGADVLRTARNLLAMEQATKQVLPLALAKVCKVARIDRQQITLAVPSAAYAAKLRQLAPRIAQLLNDGEWNVNEINVRVQAGLYQTQTKAAPREAIPLDDAALNAFDELQSALRPGPLADAVKRLIEHHRR